MSKTPEQQLKKINKKLHKKLADYLRVCGNSSAELTFPKKLSPEQEHQVRATRLGLALRLIDNERVDPSVNLMERGRLDVSMQVLEEYIQRFVALELKRQLQASEWSHNPTKNPDVVAKGATGPRDTGDGADIKKV